MTAVIPTPFVMKDAVVAIGSDTYEKAVTSVAFTPSSSVITVKAVSPGATYTDNDAATWTLDLTILQDWADPDSFSRYLFDNEGSTVSMVFTPKAGGPTVTADVSITPGAIGGASGAFAEATVSLGVSGKPVIDDTP